MFLNFEQIESAACGIVRTKTAGKWIGFYRFTEEQAEIYNRLRPGLTTKTPATAGVRLAFRTDSDRVSFKYRFIKCSSRTYGRIDLCINGVLMEHTGLDDFENKVGLADFALGEGEKTVEIYLPWTMGTEVCEMRLSDGASFEPIRRPHTMLVFGDSITQGYDGKYPSLTYANTLLRLLDAEGINKGIGGELFFPELLDAPDDIDPEWITVAYGTNDWCHLPRETIENDCRAFYQKLSALYPNAKIFAITPIWRSNEASSETPFGAPLSEARELIRELTKDLANVTVISGEGMIPHLMPFTTDGLHPNDAGGQVYAQALYLALKPYL